MEIYASLNIDVFKSQLENGITPTIIFINYLFGWLKFKRIKEIRSFHVNQMNSLVPCFC